MALLNAIKSKFSVDDIFLMEMNFHMPSVHI